ncbi:hypothetical protein V1517DRAFT_265191 [Lipomyces orientalis]|uniref:Uncharacterized protein n=1 Tax=Lipomyces orientalis TaxID=1233043 RepID=A0ACC3TGY5_9ASCO
MSVNRVQWRNVQVYDASTGATLGAFYQKGSLTEATSVWILRNVLLVVEDDWTVRFRASGRTITPSGDSVVPGDYDIYSKGSPSQNDNQLDEAWFSRLISRTVSGRDDAFRDGVRARDGKCVISGEVNDGAVWGVCPIHTNTTKDGRKVITFMPNHWRIEGRILDPDRVSDEVLRWHFRQCILANMRDAGEPVFETDFPAGTDMMATLRAEPYGKERFEMALASRLRFMAGEGEVRSQPSTCLFNAKFETF